MSELTDFIASLGYTGTGEVPTLAEVKTLRAQNQHMQENMLEFAERHLNPPFIQVDPTGFIDGLEVYLKTAKYLGKRKIRQMIGAWRIERLRL